MIITTLIVIAICISNFFYYRKKVKEYKLGSYYKITHTSYFSLRRDTGKYGEYLIYEYLKSYENIGVKFLFNIYVPKESNDTTEIDVLMISRKGLFVFESKNYGGWIFGNDYQKYWYQTLPAGRRKSHKEKFFNPVLQNNIHIKYLKTILGNEIPMYSIITFSERCRLKNVIINNPNIKIVTRGYVFQLICQLCNSIPNDILTDEQINDIYNTLYPYTQVNQAIKTQHIENINNNYKNINFKSSILENNSDGNDLSCPVCGAKLILRVAKSGNHVGEKFYGCSNFPKCKYIHEYSDKSDR